MWPEKPVLGSPYQLEACTYQNSRHTTGWWKGSVENRQGQNGAGRRVDQTTASSTVISKLVCIWPSFKKNFTLPVAQAFVAIMVMQQQCSPVVASCLTLDVHRSLIYPPSFMNQQKLHHDPWLDHISSIQELQFYHMIATTDNDTCFHRTSKYLTEMWDLQPAMSFASLLTIAAFPNSLSWK